MSIMVALSFRSTHDSRTEKKKEPAIASDGLNKPCFGNLLLVIGKSDFNSRAIN